MVRCFFCDKELETKLLNISNGAYKRRSSKDGVLLEYKGFSRWVCNDCNNYLWNKTIERLSRAKKSK